MVLGQLDQKNLEGFLDVSLAAVCVVRPTGGTPELRVLEVDGHLPSLVMSTSDEPGQLADRLVDEILSSIPERLLRFTPIVHKVAFFSAAESGEPRLQLVYTVAIPWCLDQPPSQAWVELPAGRTQSRSMQIRFEVRDLWRQLAEETTAGLALLPKYFTVPEMQDVYQAIWNVDQLSNFHRWVQSNPGMVTAVSPSQRHRADEELHRVADLGSPDHSGFNPLDPTDSAPLAVAARRAGLAAAGMALAPAALVGIGTALGYRNLKKKRSPLAKERGREPDYYTAGPLTRLEAIYAPRPSWDLPLGETVLSLLGGASNVAGDFQTEEPDGLYLTVKRASQVDREGLSVLGVNTETRGRHVALRFGDRQKASMDEVTRALGFRR